MNKPQKPKEWKFHESGKEFKVESPALPQAPSMAWISERGQQPNACLRIKGDLKNGEYVEGEYRVDTDEWRAFKAEAEKQDGGETLCWIYDIEDGEREMLGRMWQGSRIRILAAPDTEMPETIEIPLRGFRQAINRLAKHCKMPGGWTEPSPMP